MEYAMLWLVINFQFFLCTWEEYHLNTLDLPCLNGVNEGMLVVVINMIATGVMGQEFWLNRINIAGWYIRYNQIALYGVASTTIFFMILR
jgi:hypothetical protein